MIRSYREGDRNAVIDAWYAASKVATPFLSDAFLAQEREDIRNVWLPEAETWVYEADGDAVGFISLIGEGNEVGAIFVHPEHQGRGFGKALMDHAAGMHDHLFLDVFEKNAIGRRFYERYGFELEYEHVHEPTGQMQLRLSYGGGGRRVRVEPSPWDE